jgi:hypothetical protein
MRRNAEAAFGNRPLVREVRTSAESWLKRTASPRFPARPRRASGRAWRSARRSARSRPPRGTLRGPAAWAPSRSCCVATVRLPNRRSTRSATRCPPRSRRRDVQGEVDRMPAPPCERRHGTRCTRPGVHAELGRRSGRGRRLRRAGTDEHGREALDEAGKGLRPWAHAWCVDRLARRRRRPDRGRMADSPQARSRSSSATYSSSSGTCVRRLGRFTTIPSWVERARTTTASSSGEGFSSRCGTHGGTYT